MVHVGQWTDLEKLMSCFWVITIYKITVGEVFTVKILLTDILQNIYLNILFNDIKKLQYYLGNGWDK